MQIIYYDAVVCLSAEFLLQYYRTEKGVNKAMPCHNHSAKSICFCSEMFSSLNTSKLIVQYFIYILVVWDELNSLKLKNESWD